MRRGSVVKRRVLPLCPQHMTLDTRIAALVQCATTSRNTHAACTASRSSVAQVSEKDLSDQFYAYGEIKTIQVVPASNCAFVTYTTREAAEKAADAAEGGDTEEDAEGKEQKILSPGGREETWEATEEEPADA